MGLVGGEVAPRDCPPPHARSQILPPLPFCHTPHAPTRTCPPRPTLTHPPIHPPETEDDVILEATLPFWIDPGDVPVHVGEEGVEVDVRGGALHLRRTYWRNR